MPLRHKPHTLTLIEASERISGDLVVAGINYDVTAITVRGQVTPEKASTAFEKYGVQVKAPHFFMFETGDRAKVEFGNRYSMNGRVFVVESAVQLWDAEPRTAHCHCLLDELTAKGPTPES